MIKKLLLIIIITFSQATIAQSNDVLAKSYFLKVQENYSNGKNDLALKNLNKCLEILGSTNPKIEAMYVRLENDPVKRQNHLKKYFELADEEHSDQIEMIELSASVASRAEKLKAAITTKIAENISRNWEKEGPIQVWNHYYNKNKELAFQHKFIADSPFEDGIAIVFNNSGRKSRALINTKGEIISNIYSYIVKIKNGFYKCRLSSYDYGLLNRTGELISSYYENIIPIKESNLFRVNNKNDEHTLQDEYGIIDQEGKIIAETKYKEFSYFKEGLLALNPRHYYKDENAFYINKEGKKIITMPPESQGNQFNDGIAKVYNPKGSYFINKKGDKISDKVFKTASAFSEGMAFVKLNGQFYTINKHGYLTALPKALSKYEYIGALSGGVAKAVYSYRDNKGNELVTKKGTIIYTPNNIKSISNTIEKGVFIATLNNKNKVLINNKGGIIFLGFITFLLDTSL